MLAVKAYGTHGTIQEMEFGHVLHYRLNFSATCLMLNHYFDDDANCGIGSLPARTLSQMWLAAGLFSPQPAVTLSPLHTLHTEFFLWLVHTYLE